VIIVEYKSVDN